MDINLINSTVVATVTAVVGIYPYYSRRNEITRLFAVSNLWLASWNIVDFVVLLPVSHAVQLFLYRLSVIAGVFVVWYFFNFMLAFAHFDASRFKRTRLGIAMAGSFVSVLSFTPLIFKDIDTTTYPFEVPGSLYPLFIIYLLGAFTFALFRLYETYRSSVGQQQIQSKYMMMALFFGFLEGPLFFFDVYTNKIASFFYYSQIFYSVLVAYAILAHSLMDISIIIRKTAIYSAVTGALTGIYLLIATQLAKMLQGANGEAGFVSSAVAAVAVTLLFNPLLNRIRLFMDERFFGNWLKDMSRGVVHEVKRPLASISMPAELTLMELEDIEREKGSFENYLPIFKERLRGIVQKTMEASDRIEALYSMANPHESDVTSVDIENVVTAGVAAMRTVITLSSTTCVLDMSKTPPVKANPKQLEIVLVNLIKNAVESMTSLPLESRRMGIRTYQEGKWVIVAVKDAGLGIPRDDWDRIFEPQFTTKGSSGTGVGLFLAQQIVKSHGGHIKVWSELGKGTEFVVRLPSHAAEGSAAA